MHHNHHHEIDPDIVFRPGEDMKAAAFLADFGENLKRNRQQQSSTSSTSGSNMWKFSVPKLAAAIAVVAIGGIASTLTVFGFILLTGVIQLFS